MVSAKKNLRRSIGFGKNKEIYKDAVDRIEEVKVNQGVM